MTDWIHIQVACPTCQRDLALRYRAPDIDGLTFAVEHQDDDFHGVIVTSRDDRKQPTAVLSSEGEVRVNTLR